MKTPRTAHIEPLETRIAPAFVSGTVNLADLAGANGSKLQGASAGNFSGSAVSAAGDVNGDGLDDFVVGEEAFNFGVGAAAVIFGTATGFPANVTLDSSFLNGTKGFRITGGGSGARLGGSVSAAGDVNGDGFDDVIVGARFADGPGAAYLIFGKASGFAAQFSVAGLDGTSGFKISGATAGDRAGIAVSGAGDVNGDSFDDVIVGADGIAAGKGAAFLIYGKAGGFAANLALSGLTTEGVRLDGVSAGDGAGAAVSGAGDVNGDGLADVIIGAPKAEGGTKGAAYVVFGSKTLSATIGLDTLTGSTGFKLKGVADNDGTGGAVNGAGDVNGDGCADVIVGASKAQGGNNRGAAHVVFGHAGAFLNVTTLDTLNGVNGFSVFGPTFEDFAGASLSGAGDVNGDGIDDLIIGAPQNGTSVPDAGDAYLIFGRTGIFTAPNLVAPDVTNLVRLHGVASEVGAGTAVSGAGDVNGDGFADLLVSNPKAGGNAGASYLVLGGPSGFLIDPTITGGKSATFTDVDGDLVTVKVSAGTLTNASFQLLEKGGGSGRAQLLALTLDSTFDGADVSITAKRAGGGDGKVNVGFINSAGVDLGNVTVGGDLGRIDAGDTDDGIALKSLTVGSLGLFGGRTGDTGVGLSSKITGPVGAVKIAGDVDKAKFEVAAAASAGTGKIASFTLGGNLIGGARAGSGSILAFAIGSLKVGGDLVGGRGANTGRIGLDENLGSLTVGGSLLGGEGDASGSVDLIGILGAASIAGDLRGSSGVHSARIVADTGIGALKIGGSQIAGAGGQSALIFSLGNIASVSIGGDATSSAAAFSGGILANGTLGPVTIKGDVTGTVEQPYLIRGSGPQSGTKSVAIASVKVGGDFDHALVLGGYGSFNAPENGHAQIGAISVGGDWIASSVVAGLLPHGDADDATGVFGDGDDEFFNGGPEGVVASIASVTIKGAARGTFADGDRFAIVAEQIGSVSIGGAKLALTKSTTPDPANDLTAIHVGATPDFVVREVSRMTAAPADTFTATPAAGARTAIPAAIGLGTLASADGFKLSGVAAGDRAGNPVSDAGDVNGDGFDDFIVAAFTADEGGNNRGAAYVVFGQAGGLSSLNLSSLNGANGFKLTGLNSGDLAGLSVSAAGDVNGDGFDDVIVGAPKVDADFAADPNDNRGAAYVVFGRSSFAGNASIALSSLDGFTGFRLLGPPGSSPSAEAGTSVGGAGDVNGDGLDDIIVGAPGANAGSGSAFVIFGQRHFASAPAPGFSLDLATLAGTGGFSVFNLGGGGKIGSAVSGAGDVNGDGFADVIIGAPLRNGTGAAYVVFGKSNPVSISTDAITGAAGFTLNGVASGDEAGGSVRGAGDVNGDGFADVIVGASKADGTSRGAGYVFFGGSAALNQPIGLGSLDGGNGFKLGGLSGGDRTGDSVSGAGDVNGDGFADLIVGADYVDELVTSPDDNRGAAYVLFGKSRFTGTPAPGFSIDLPTLDGANGFKLSGAGHNDFAGQAVSAAGDINGDGFGDVIVGANGAGGALLDAGAAYVIYGGPSGEFIDPTFSNGGKVATWTDVDGDLVTLKVSKGTLDAGNFKLLAKDTADSRAQLLALNLGSEFDSADVSLTAKRAVGGDGKVNVGHLNAIGVDLGAVTVGGDLGRIRAGDTDAGLAFKSLTVGSLGVFGGRTQDTGGELLSSTSGPAGALKILGDVRDAAFAAITSGVQPGSLASVTIGGDLSGTGPLLGASNLFLLGQVGPGTIAASNTIGPVKIGGDLVGGRAAYSGYLFSGSIGTISLGGSLVGGGGLFSGAIIGGTVGNVSIGGSQIGGAGLGTGYIAATSGLGKVNIRHDQIGGGAASGLIFTQNPGANIASVTIGGDARGGDAAFSGGILAGGTLGPVVVKGDVIGTADHAFTIRGSGPVTVPTGVTKSVAIASLKVGGDFDHALVLAGYANDNVPANGHAQIGAITIGGDWIASSVTAGLLTHPGAPNAIGIFGDADDTFITGGPANVVASIASITIKGRALGSLETGDRFGIVAEQIGSVTLGGVKLAFTTANKNDGFFVGPTPDFLIGEVAR